MGSSEDREIVMDAVKQKVSALEFASKDHQKDREIVKAEVN